LVENAGGASSGDGQSVSALDVPITGIDQRTQVCLGSRIEVARFEHFMYGKVSERLAATLTAEELARATAPSKSEKLITDAADPSPAFVAPKWPVQPAPQLVPRDLPPCLTVSRYCMAVTAALPPSRCVNPLCPIPSRFR